MFAVKVKDKSKKELALSLARTVTEEDEIVFYIRRPYMQGDMRNTLLVVSKMGTVHDLIKVLRARYFPLAEKSEIEP